MKLEEKLSESPSLAFTKLYDQMMACNIIQDSDWQENKLPNGTHPSPTYASAWRSAQSKSWYSRK